MTAGLIAATVLTPFIGAIAIALSKPHPRLRNFFALATPFVTLTTVTWLALLYLQTGTASFTALTLAPNLTVGFMVEPVSVFFACIVALLWPLSMLYALTYLYEKQLADKTRFCVFFTIAIGCTFGVAFAGDLLCLLVFYEALTFSTYPLVVHTQTAEAKRAGRVYLAFLAGTSIVLLLPAVIWIWTTHSTLQFTDGGILSTQASGWLLVLLVFGVGKMALMPLHRWLPSAMAAPPPVSALLHAVAVVKAGVFTLAKILIYIYGLDDVDSNWLVYVAGFSIIAASFIALRQDNLKARLAYSTISHLSYIVMGLALLKPAIVGALLHLLAHALGKITLFFAAGALEVGAGKKKVSELRGIGFRMPWTMTCFAVASLTLIGLPPTAGFWSKWHLLGGSMHAEHYFAVGVLIVSTILNVAYLLPIVTRAFTRSSDDSYCEVSASMLIPMLIPTAIVIILFFSPAPALVFTSLFL